MDDDKVDTLAVKVLRALCRAVAGILLELVIYGLNTLVLLVIRTVVLEFLIAHYRWTREDVIWYTTNSLFVIKWVIFVNFFSIIQYFIDEAVYTYIANERATEDWHED